MRAADYLGRPIAELLHLEPFTGWRTIRTLEGDPKPEVWYEFDGHGVEVICDIFERIRTIFLHRGGDGESFAEIPFRLTRRQVLATLGTPVKSGDALSIPGIGDRGAWDQFSIPEGTVHVQYGNERDEIELITLMRPDAVP